MKPEKRLDPTVPIARKTITHRSNNNADGFGAPNFNTTPTGGQRIPGFGGVVSGHIAAGSPTSSNHSSANSEFQTPNFGLTPNFGQNTTTFGQNIGFQLPVSYSSHVEPPRRQIAFKTIVPFRPLNVSKSPENPLKPKYALKPKPKPVIYMKNLRLTTPKTTEQLIQKYSTPEVDEGAVKKVGNDQMGSGHELNSGVNTSFSSPTRPVRIRSLELPKWLVV